MTASREAYDLHNPACRANAWYRLKRGDWKRLWFLRLIWSDTINNVCTVRKANTPVTDAEPSTLVNTRAQGPRSV